MADTFEFKLEGFQELQDRLSKLQVETAAKNIVQSAFAANRYMADAMKDRISANGSVDTGLLRDSIVRKRIIYDKQGTIVIITGVSKSTKGVDQFGNPRVPWRYAHLVDAKLPFVQPAFDSSKQLVLDEFIINILKKVKRFEKG